MARAVQEDRREACEEQDIQAGLEVDTLQRGYYDEKYRQWKRVDICLGNGLTLEIARELDDVNCTFYDKLQRAARRLMADAYHTPRDEERGTYRPKHFQRYVVELLDVQDHMDVPEVEWLRLIDVARGGGDVRVQPCKWYDTRTGHCKFGPRCTNIHEGPTSTTRHGVWGDD